MIDRSYGDYRVILQSPDGGSIFAASVRNAKNIDDTGSCKNPRIGAIERHAAGIAPGTDAGFTQVIPACPHEVTHQIGVFLYHLPVFPDVLREGLGAEYHTVRMGFFLQWIPTGTIVVTCNIQAVKERCGQRIDLGRVAALIHAGADKGSDDVEHEACVLAFLLFLSFSAAGLLFTVLIDSLSFGCTSNDHQIGAAGNRAGRIKLVTKIHHRPSGIDALLFTGLSYFVANGIENYRWMIEVSFHHGGSILFPPLVKIHTVVVGIFAVVPHIEGLIHDVHTKFVAGFQHGRRSRIVGRPNRIEAVFLQNPDAAFFALSMGNCTENTIVMMNTATS